jgi:hypothetical protein
VFNPVGPGKRGERCYMNEFSIDCIEFHPLGSGKRGTGCCLNEFGIDRTVFNPVGPGKRCPWVLFKGNLLLWKLTVCLTPVRSDKRWT